jgi:LPXTG-site transpeptidase (sortase) family protein
MREWLEGSDINRRAGRGKRITLRLAMIALLVVALAGMGTLCMGQSLGKTTAGRMPDRLWKAMPLVVQIPAPAVRAISFSPGETIGRILIPRMSLDSPLLEMANCDDQVNLNRGPAHIGGTAAPGSAGNCAIAGHRSTYTRPFEQMGALQAGDEMILVDRSGARYVYTVSRVWVVSPDEVSVLDPTPEPSVTLITCHPLGSAHSRLIVRAVMSR